MRTRKLLHIALLFVLPMTLANRCTSVRATAPSPPAACALSAADRAWLDDALEAWRFTTREITEIRQFPEFKAVIFDARCTLTSHDALTTASGQAVTWVAAPHEGEILLPDGAHMPVGVTSHTTGNNDAYYFVMSTPSVWEAAGVGAGEDLRRLMIAVLLHEGSHVAQIVPYGPRLDALIERHALPDSFNDDTLQKRFQENEEIASSVKRETELFVAAAAAREDREAERLAREGLRLLRARQERWFTGDEAYFAEAEDLWLTFEGAGQWAAYRWMIDPRGGGAEPAEALARFARGRWWSQTEGFAVVLALDRIMGPAWKSHAFGDGEKTILELLDQAVAAH